MFIDILLGLKIKNILYCIKEYEYFKPIYSAPSAWPNTRFKFLKFFWKF